MKKIIFVFVVLPTITWAQSQTAPTQTTPVVNVTPQASIAAPVNTDGPVIKMTEETFDFGDIPQGKPVTHIFNVENAGKAPLVISQATASCGCTTPVWSHEPILPSQSGNVTVTFNAEKEGTFIKTITLLTNTADPKYIYIKGNVLPKVVSPDQQPNIQAAPQK